MRANILIKCIFITQIDETKTGLFQGEEGPRNIAEYNIYKEEKINIIFFEKEKVMIKFITKKKKKKNIAQVTENFQNG